MILRLLIFIFIFASIDLNAQDSQHPECGQIEYMKKFYQEHPDKKMEYEESEAIFLQEQIFRMNSREMNDDTLIIIPTVVHIIHNYGDENIPNQLVYDAIAQMNADYSASASDISTIVDDFEDIIGNAQIEFRLAQYDEEQNCTTGITRTVSDLTYFGGDDAKQLIQWDRSKYLNIWVCDVALDTGDPSQIVNGYAPFPSWSSSPEDAWMDGIMVRWQAIGTGERTLTHEAGHWLNLRHTWGNSEVEDPANCTNGSTDLVSDTPKTIGNFGGCATGTESCGSLDNIQNHMEYTTCKRMFTEGQVNRMRTTLDSPTSSRNNLGTLTNLEFTGVLEEANICSADFGSDVQRVCTEDEVEFTPIGGNGITEFNWTFEGGSPASSDEEQPTVTWDEPGLYQVSLTVGNGTDEVSEIKNDYILVLEDFGLESPYTEGFESASDIPNEDWVVYSTDHDQYFELTDNASSSGDQSIYLKNYSQDDWEFDYLESNSIDLSGLSDVYISFKYAYARRTNSSEDQLKFRVSRTCGSSWITRATLDADDDLPTAPNHLGNFTPSSDEWSEVIIDNISDLYLVGNFRMRFEFRAGDGNNIYIDDINIYDPNFNSVNEINKENLGFTLFPNPSNSLLNLRFNLLKEHSVKGQILDPSGRLVKELFDGSRSIGINQEVWDISSLSPGIYVFRLTIGNESFSQRFVKL